MTQEHGVACIRKRVVIYQGSLMSNTWCGRDDRGTISLEHYRTRPDHVESLRKRGQLCEQCEVLINDE